MSLIIKTQPTAEPVTVEEVKAQLRLTASDDDALLASLIPAARDYAEKVTGWSFAAKTYVDTMDGFPRPYTPIRLLRPPVLEVVSIQYLDSDYEWVTWDPAEYFAFTGNVPAVVMHRDQKVYPDAKSIRVEYKVGVHDSPNQLQAIRSLAVHYYSHPDAVTSEALKEMPLAISSAFKADKVYQY